MNYQEFKDLYDLPNHSLKEFPKGSGWFNILFVDKKVHFYIHEDNMGGKLEVVPQGTAEYKSGVYETFVGMPADPDQRRIKMDDLEKKTPESQEQPEQELEEEPMPF